MQTRLSVLAVLLLVRLLHGQALPQQVAFTPHNPSVPSSFLGRVTTNASATCLEPPALPGLGDYDGPMKKGVGIFARALERKSVHEPRYKTGLPLCSMEIGDKFMFFLTDVTDPMTFVSAGFSAAIDHATNRDPTFGQGADGFTRRLSAQVADRASSKFFKDFAYPTLFNEDPRYYRLGDGNSRARLLHAVEHVVLAYSPEGKRMFNYSEWLGTGTAVAISNLCHPGNERDPGAVASQIGFRFAVDAGYDILREFWPDIARKFKLPFRGVEKSSPIRGAALPSPAD